MNIHVLFGISIAMSFVAFGLVTKIYILPHLRALPRQEALLALMMPHTFRFIGLSFLVPGVVSSHATCSFCRSGCVRRLGCRGTGDRSGSGDRAQTALGPPHPPAIQS